MLTDPGLGAPLPKGRRQPGGQVASPPGRAVPHRYTYPGSLMAVAVRVDRYLIRLLVGR
jgi:hypothetical protein